MIDYALAGESYGFAAIATTDHGPYVDNRWPNFRMSWADIDDHIRAIEAARNAARIGVISGFEYEYIPTVTEQTLSLLRERLSINLVLFGPHVLPRHGTYVNAYTAVAEQCDAVDFLAYCADAIDSGLFDIAAHPDLVTRFIETIQPECQAALDRFVQACLVGGVVCELNAAELTLNPHRPSYYQFWRTVAEARLPVFVSSDAHAPSALNAGRARAKAFAGQMGLSLAANIGHCVTGCGIAITSA